MPPQLLIAFIALTFAALAVACVINSRFTLRRALRERSEELDALHNRLLRMERRADASAFHRRRSEAVEIDKPARWAGR